MTTTRKKQPQTRKRHSQQYKTEALALADRVGVAAAAKQLGLHDSQLYSWRSKARLGQERSEVEERLAVENARLKLSMPLNSVSAFGGQDHSCPTRSFSLSGIKSSGVLPITSTGSYPSKSRTLGLA